MWTVLDSFPGTPQQNYFLMCLVQCDCGTKRLVTFTRLKYGGSKNCGCVRRKLASQRLWKHGKTNCAEFGIWHNMVQKCHDPKHKSFKNYGAVGIEVCEKWRNSFEAFYRDMGPRPQKKNLDRIDDLAGYTPENTIWSTISKVSLKWRFRRLINVRGQIKSILDWAQEAKIDPNLLRNRLRRKVPPEAAIFGYWARQRTSR